MRQSLRKWSVNSAWFATSMRYSKTSPRGRAMLVSTLKGSTGRESIPRRTDGSGRSGGESADAETVLQVKHQVRANGLGAAPRTAQLADRVALVAMDALADQRLAPALRAARAA